MADNGIMMAARSATTSNDRAIKLARSLCMNRAKTPIENAKPIAVAVTECRKSSNASYGSSATQGLWEKAAVESINTPKAKCIQYETLGQDDLREMESQSTANPNRINPSLAIHAFWTPCAADSLIALDCHE